MEDNSHAGQGPVVLDIGGDIGALIVTMPAALAGAEVEARPVAGAAFESYAPAATCRTSPCWPGPARRCGTPRCSPNCRTGSTSCTCARTSRPA